MRERVKYRPATRSDVEKFYKESRFTFRAIALEINDITVGIGGVYLDGTNLIVFSTGTEELDDRPYLRAKSTILIMKIVKQYPCCLAIESDTISTSAKILRRVGFEKIDNKVWKWTRPQSK